MKIYSLPSTQQIMT